MNTTTQHQNFSVRLRAAIDRRFQKSGLKDYAVKGSDGNYQETETRFFDSLEEITLDELQSDQGEKDETSIATEDEQ